MTASSDAELIAESLGDAARFGEIFDRHAQSIFRFLARRIGHDDAADVLADVFVAAFEARPRYDARHASARPWLFGIASNLLGKHFRRRGSDLRMLANAAGDHDGDDPSDAVVASVDAQTQVGSMAKQLEELPPGERHVLLLHTWEDLTYDEIANALAIPVGTVRSRLNRVRKRLRAGMDEIEGVRAVRPDLLATIPDASPSVLAQQKESLMQGITEGKTKVIEDAGTGEVLIRSKNDITAGEGAKHDVLDGKAAASTSTTSNIFSLLERNGVPTHFVGRVDEVTFRARNVQMIPMELVARRYVAGSFSDRFPDLPQGHVFEELVFEMFEKDDANHDPLLQFDFQAGVLRRYAPNKAAAEAVGPEVKPGDLVSEEPLRTSRYANVSPELIEELRHLTLSTFSIIEAAWKGQGGVYIDFKIECGFDRETGALLIADVIDSDSGRLRFDDVDMSKQSYRDGAATLPEIKKKFDEVASLTDNFA